MRHVREGVTRVRERTQTPKIAAASIGAMPRSTPHHEPRPARRPGSTTSSSRSTALDRARRETDRSGPDSLARGVRRLPCLPGDAAAIERRLPHIPVRRELPGSEAHRYLDDLIGKDWGQEQRIYDDDLVDVWLLDVVPGAGTSAHCHPRKHTVLLCLEGEGELTAGDGRRTPIVPGTVLQIEQGAMHRSTATRRHLRLVEVETPRDKFDLLRDEDGRAGYEDETNVLRRLAPLRDSYDGPRRARLRDERELGGYRVALERGSDLARHGAGLLFAVALDTASVMRRDLAVAGPLTEIAPHPRHTHLTIRTA
jgi:mannose-6-phosphate isomerase-like protein (cupin superfamily)